MQEDIINFTDMQVVECGDLNSLSKVKNIKNYLFYKLFFPKVVRINHPGIIYDYVHSKFGNRKLKKRLVWCFEDIFVSLQRETIKKIGKRRTNDLWYKIGKDTGTRYMLLAKLRKPPSSLVPTILEYILSLFQIQGISLAEEYTFDKKKGILILRGKNNIICRKSGVGSYFSGIVSALFSFLMGENIEAKKPKCSKHNGFCKVIANRQFSKFYIPVIKELQPMKDYIVLNFPPKRKVKGNYHSFSDLCRFKKISIDKYGKVSFMGNVIGVGEAGFLGIVTKYYIDNSMEDILEAGLQKGAEEVIRNIVSNDNITTHGINTVMNLVCALGWGIPTYRIVNKNLILSLHYPPFNKYGFEYLAFVIKGYISFIYRKRIKLEKIITKKSLFRVEIRYRL